MIAKLLVGFAILGLVALFDYVFMLWDIRRMENTVHQWKGVFVNPINTFTNCYFKATFEEGCKFISGLPMPDHRKGPYLFIDCDIHARLWEACTQLYKTSEFRNTYIGPTRSIDDTDQSRTD